MASDGIDRVTQPHEQGAGFEQRQSDDVAIGAADRGDEAGRPALDGVAAGLALPFAAGQIRCSLVGAQSLEYDLRCNDPNSPFSNRCDDAKAADNAVTPTGKQLETELGARTRIGLRKDAAAAGHDGVGG